MKKYWKLIALTTIIVITFGIYYFHAQYISDSFAQFEIETLEGDEAYVEPVMISGDLYTSFFSSEYFKITSKGTEYIRDKPFPENLGFYYPEKIVKLQQEYRRFMRSKEKYIENYDENEAIIAYATIPYTRWGIKEEKLELAILDKATKQARKLVSPLTEYYSYISVHGVTVHDEEVSVITLNERYRGEGLPEHIAFHVYTFDLQSEKLVNEAVIPLEADQDGMMTYGLLMHEKSIPDEIITSEMTIDVIEKTSGAMVVGETTDYALEYEERFKAVRLQKYNLKTNQIEEISLPENAGVPIKYNGKEIIFVNVDGKNIRFMRYDIEKNQQDKILEVEVGENDISVWEIETGVVQDGHYYINSLSQLDFARTALPVLTIIDLETLEVKYRGQIVNVNSNSLSHNEVYFHQLELKE